jgi:FtsP/CotA-like multicopper oxidase with cupredoxin domain
VGNLLLVNGQVINGDGAPLKLTIPRGGIERWRFVLATNALAYGLRIKGADAKVIATDGGLLPKPFALDRVEIAPGQRYDFEVRPTADAKEVVLEALIDVLDANNMVVEQAFPLAKATVEGEVTSAEPVYPTITLPPVDVTAENLDWKLAGALVAGKVEFTINGMAWLRDRSARSPAPPHLRAERADEDHPA